MRPALALIAATLAVAALHANAAPTLYRVVRADGTIVYTNERVPGATPVSRDDVPPPPPEPAPAAAPAGTAPPAAPAPRDDARPPREKPAPR